MTDPESLKKPNSLSSREDNFEHLTQDLSSLRTWLTNFTQQINILPRQIDQILEILNPINKLLNKEFSSKNELLENFNSIQARLDIQVKQFNIEASNLHENLQLSNDFVRKIESLGNEQDISQSEYNKSLQLSIVNIKETVAALEASNESLTQRIQSFNSDIEASVNKIRLDTKKEFSEYISKFETLQFNFISLQSESNHAIEECKTVISDYQSKSESNKNISQNIIDKIVDSRFTLLAMNVLVIIALLFILVKLFLPQENSLPVRNIPKHSAVKPSRNPKQ